MEAIVLVLITSLVLAKLQWFGVEPIAINLFASVQTSQMVARMESAILQAIALAIQDGKDTIARFHSLAITP